LKINREGAGKINSSITGNRKDMTTGKEDMTTEREDNSFSRK
jgi:hypothetical protein